MPKQSNDRLAPLLATLKAEQHALIDSAAETGGLPTKNELRQIAELENAIAAVLALIEERAAG